MAILYKQVPKGQQSLYMDDDSVGSNKVWNSIPTKAQDAYRARAKVGYYSKKALAAKHGEEALTELDNNIYSAVSDYKTDEKMSDMQKSYAVAAKMSSANPNFEIASDKYGDYLDSGEIEGLQQAQGILNGVSGSGTDASAIGYRNYASPKYNIMSNGSKDDEASYNMTFDPQLGYSINNFTTTAPIETRNTGVTPVKKDGGVLFVKEGRKVVTPLPRMEPIAARLPEVPLEEPQIKLKDRRMTWDEAVDFSMQPGGSQYNWVASQPAAWPEGSHDYYISNSTGGGNPYKLAAELNQRFNIKGHGRTKFQHAHFRVGPDNSVSWVKRPSPNQKDKQRFADPAKKSFNNYIMNDLYQNNLIRDN